MAITGYPNYNKDFTISVAEGEVPGYSNVQVQGYNSAVNTTWTNFWPGPTLLIPRATSATTMTVSSSNAADTAAGVGAHTVYINGLDGSYNTVSETVTLNGTTGVSTANSYLRINNFRVATAGTNNTASGNIYIGTGTVTGGVPAVTYEMIPVDYNSEQSHIYTVPAGYTGYIQFARFTFAQTAGTDAALARLGVTGTDNIKRIVVNAAMNNGVTILTPSEPIKVPEKTTVAGETKGLNNQNLCTAFVQMLLVQNGY